MQGPKDGDGQQSRISAISFGGQNAAIAAKSARQIDLHTIAIRNDLGEPHLSCRLFIQAPITQ